MSFYSDASLVLIPSGYKNQKIYSAKPTDGSADLAFTRASDATRVASNGLIEKVRTNLLERSSLIADWQTAQLTVDSTAVSDPFGGTNAGRYTASGVASAYVFPFNAPSVTSGTTYTGSFYVKDVDANYVQLTFGTGGFGSGQYQNFDLTNGTKGSGAGSTSTITSVGNGWYRITLTATATATSTAGIVCVVIPSASSARLATANAGQTFEASAYQMEQGDIATDYIATTTTAVSVGPVSGLPRLDYLNSSCPRLLLEGQRSNLITFSEQINDASWSKAVSGSGIAPVVTANYGISPSGYQDADRVQFNAVGTTASDRSLLRKLITLSATQHALSFYVKSNSGTATLAFTFNGASVGTITATESAWTRVEYVGTGTGALSTYGIELTGNTTSATADILFWGAQLEAGAYATSYIPTLSTSVTRVADAASKTGISSLIGQTEGTIFADVTLTSRSSFSYFAIAPNLGSTSAYIGIGITSSVFSFEVVNSGVQVAYNFPNTSTGNFKIAFAYKANDFVAYVNGVQVHSDTSGTVPACSQLGLNAFSNAAAWNYNQALLFKTRLTNAQMQELTSL
jgi:hypothetical protein